MIGTAMEIILRGFRRTYVHTPLGYIYLGVKLLGHTVCVYSALTGIAQWFSTSTEYKSSFAPYLVLYFFFFILVILVGLGFPF